MGIAYGNTGLKGKVIVQTHVPKNGSDGKKVVLIPTDDVFIKSMVNELNTNETADALFKFKLEDAELLYKNRKIDQAQKKYKNLEVLTSFEDGSYLNDEIYSASTSQLRKIRLGLNYFGYSPVFVPILDRSVYESRMERLLKVANRIYTNYLQIENADRTQDIVLALEKIYQFEVQYLISDLDDEIQNSINQIELYSNDTNFYEQKHKYLTDQISEMMAQEDRLMRATSGGDSFDFIDFVKGTAKVYTGGKAVISAWKAASIASASDLFDFIKDNEDPLSKIAKGFSESGIMTLFSSNKKKLYSEVDLLPLQNQIREFTYEILDVSQQLSAANIKILQERSRINSLNSRKIQVRQTQAAITEQLENAFNTANDLELMKADTRLTLSHVMDLTHEYLFYYVRAQQFWNHQNTENQIRYENLNPNHTSQQFERAKSLEIEYYASIETGYTQENQPIQIVFNREDFRLKFEEFEQSGIFNFSLDESMFPDEMRLIRLVSIGFKLEGDGLQGETVSGFLAHDGESRFINETGDELIYTHTPQKIFLKYALPVFEQLNSPISDYKKSYISPLSNWRLILKKQDSEIDRQKIDQITIRCHVLYKPILT